MHDVTFSAMQSMEGTYRHGEAFLPPSVKFGFGLVGNWGVYTQCVDQSSDCGVWKNLCLWQLKTL